MTFCLRYKNLSTKYKNYKFYLNLSFVQTKSKYKMHQKKLSRAQTGAFSSFNNLFPGSDSHLQTFEEFWDWSWERDWFNDWRDSNFIRRRRRQWRIRRFGISDNWWWTCQENWWQAKGRNLARLTHYYENHPNDSFKLKLSTLYK